MTNTSAAMTNFDSISSSDLETVSGSGDGIISRDNYVGGGKLLGGAAGDTAAAAGAATLTAPTGPGAVAAGIGARAVGTGAGQWVGGKVGGAIFDAGSWMGTKVGNWLYPSK